MFRHFKFLKLVFFHSISAFGGPQAHLGMMFKTFVKRTPYVSEAELLEYNAFCQLLPGASSTQIITLIGYKRGGIVLAIFTLLTWILPACLIMGLISFGLVFIDKNSFQINVLKFIPAMAIGFLIYGAMVAFKISIKNLITWIIMLVATVVSFIVFKSPWIFPVLIVAGGIATNFSKKRIPENEIPKHKNIKWGNLWLFIFILIIAIIIGGQARKNNWEYRKPIILFENMYRMGSYVFGGGQVLMPLLYEQYSIRPEVVIKKKKNLEPLQVNKEDMLVGIGMVRAMPGPVFSVAAFTGGMALNKNGVYWQILGILVSIIAIFLPSVLLVLFFFPVWNNIQKYAFIYRSLEGINASVMGIMIGSIIFMMKDINLFGGNYGNLLVMLLTLLLSFFTRLRPPYIVILVLVLGYIL